MARSRAARVHSAPPGSERVAERTRLVQPFAARQLRRRRSINDAAAWTELYGRTPAPARLSQWRVCINRFLDQCHKIYRLQYSESFNRYLFSEVGLVRNSKLCQCHSGSSHSSSAPSAISDSARYSDIVLVTASDALALECRAVVFARCATQASVSAR